MVTLRVADAAMESLADLGVRVAYIFGSVARGEAGPLSDLDVAVLLGRELPEWEALGLAGDIAAEIEPLGGGPVDVVILDAAPPALRFSVISEGSIIFNQDDDLRQRFEEWTVAQYLDTEHLRRTYRSYLYRRLREKSHAHPA